MNTLISSLNILQISSTEQYTVKDDEVVINNNIFKKKDVEISINGNHENANQLDVKVGILQRDSHFAMCADLKPFNRWQVNGVQSTSLGQLVESINTSIK